LFAFYAHIGCVNTGCLLTSLRTIVGPKTSHARPIRRTDTSYATAPETARPVDYVLLRLQLLLPVLLPLLKDRLNDSSVRRQVGAMEDVIRMTCSASPSTGATQWAIYRSRNVFWRRRAPVELVDSEVQAARRRRANISGPTTKISICGTPYPALSSTAKMTMKSLLNNLYVKLHSCRLEALAYFSILVCAPP